MQVSRRLRRVTTDAEAEHQRIRATYAPARPRDLAVSAVMIGLLVIASLVRQVSWAFVVGAITASLAWELSKFRLRRNARDFAQGSR